VARVHISRIGLTPVKGGRHGGQPSVELTPDGPVGDRVFCLVDRARGRVLRTVENPTLLQTLATWHDGLLTATLPGRTVEGAPVASGELLEVDYWGRTAALEVVDGPWAEAYSAHLGSEVVLARSQRPGEVVYGAPVSLVSTSSLELLGQRAGTPVDSAALRSTFTVDTTGEEAHVEDGWVGHRVRLGDAEVEVRSVLPRCAVIDLDPDTGARRSDLMRTLAGYRRAAGEVLLGVDAVVTVPGRVDLDARVERGS
jgi:uncharacterized protein YcbX